MTVITQAEILLEMEKLWRSRNNDLRKAHYWVDPQQERDRKAEYRRENPEKIVACRASFYRRNREKVKAKVAIYKARKRAEAAMCAE